MGGLKVAGEEEIAYAEGGERTRLLFLPVALSLQVGTGFSAYVPTLGLAYRL